MSIWMNIYCLLLNMRFKKQLLLFVFVFFIDFVESSHTSTKSIPLIIRRGMWNWLTSPVSLTFIQRCPLPEKCCLSSLIRFSGLSVSATDTLHQSWTRYETLESQLARSVMACPSKGGGGGLLRRRFSLHNLLDILFRTCNTHQRTML